MNILGQEIILWLSVNPRTQIWLILWGKYFCQTWRSHSSGCQDFGLLTAGTVAVFEENAMVSEKHSTLIIRVKNLKMEAPCSNLPIRLYGAASQKNAVLKVNQLSCLEIICNTQHSSRMFICTSFGIYRDRFWDNMNWICRYSLWSSMCFIFCTSTLNFLNLSRNRCTILLTLLNIFKENSNLSGIRVL